MSASLAGTRQPGRYLAPITVAAMLIFIAGQSACAELLDVWFPSYCDAEKSPDNPDDDLMCWAAAASNALSWGNWAWNAGGGLSDAQTTFDYFQDHWSDAAGKPYYAIKWFLTGQNEMPVGPDWSELESPGGGFYPNVVINDVLGLASVKADGMSFIADQLAQQRVAVLSLAWPLHLVTCWGYRFDPSAVPGTPDYYRGIWITDSDDLQAGLRYYDVTLAEEDDLWHLPDYGEKTNIYEVTWLAHSGLIPEPATLLLLALGATAIAGKRR